MQHPLSEERKVKSEENRCPFGTFLIIFVRKYLFFSLFILLSSLGCCILQQPHFLMAHARSSPCRKHDIVHKKMIEYHHVIC